MKPEHPTLTIRSSDSLDSVQKKLGLTAPPEPMQEADGDGYYYHLADLGFWVFFDSSKQVYSIRFDDSYQYTVEGVGIGDSKEQVLSARGKPDRYFPIPGGEDRWLYDKPSFFRVDFDPVGGKVEKMFR